MEQRVTVTASGCVQTGKDKVFKMKLRYTCQDVRPMFKAMHNLQHYRGKRLGMAEEYKKQGRNQGEKGGRKEEKVYCLDRWLACKGDAMLRPDAWPARPERRDTIGKYWLSCRQDSTSLVRTVRHIKHIPENFYGSLSISSVHFLQRDEQIRVL